MHNGCAHDGTLPKSMHYVGYAYLGCALLGYVLYTHYNPHNVHIRIKCGTTEAIALYRFILLSSVTNVHNDNLCLALVK